MATRTIPKRCRQCKQTFPATTEFFHRDKSRKDGLMYECKHCRSQLGKQYDQIHKTEHQQRNKQYYQTHKSKLLQHRRQCARTIQGYMRRLWHSLLNRCNNPKHDGYKYYGGRGIKVKFASFQDFYNYIIKELKADPRGLTIDRTNNNGHYERGNIRFVTQAENNRNKRR